MYECDDIPNVGNPTQINGVFVCENAVKVDRVTMISDLYDCLMEYQQQGLFRIRPLDTISDKEIQSVHNDLGDYDNCQTEEEIIEMIKIGGVQNDSNRFAKLYEKSM